MSWLFAADSVGDLLAQGTDTPLTGGWKVKCKLAWMASIVGATIVPKRRMAVPRRPDRSHTETGRDALGDRVRSRDETATWALGRLSSPAVRAARGNGRSSASLISTSCRIQCAARSRIRATEAKEVRGLKDTAE